MSAITLPARPDPSRATVQAVLDQGNPFSDHRVTSVGPQAVDVPSIHEGEFRRVVSLAERACRQNEAIGAVVWGESGSGKSNLLRRVREWAGGGERAFAVAVLELQAAPERLHRSVLNAVLSALTNGLTPPWHRTPLYQLLQGVLRSAAPAGPKKLPPWELERLFRSRMADVLGAAGTTGTTRGAVDLLFQVLLAALAEKSQRPEQARGVVALRRLGGDALGDNEALALGLHPAETAQPLDAAESVRVLAVLAQLARASNKPLILTFDQIHTLRRPQVADIFALLHVLNDDVRNVLLILSEVQEEVEKLRHAGTVTQATWDRVQANKIEMPRLTLPEGRRILEARLAAYFRESLTDPGFARQRERDPLFPLGEKWFEAQSARLIDVRPRHLLHLARLRWEELQGKPDTEKPPIETVIDELVGKAFIGRLTHHRADPKTLPPNGNNLCGLVKSLLGLADARITVTPAGLNSPYDLVVRVPQIRGESVSGLVFVTTGRAKSFTGTLSHLIADTHPPGAVLLVSDQRLPLPFGKSAHARGRQHFDTLTARPGFAHIALTFDDYATLEALDAIARNAADLELDQPYRPLSGAEVVASYHRGHRLTAHPLLGRLLHGLA